MPSELSGLLPPEVFKILLVLFLSFLVGLEREEHKVVAGDHYSFGGVRTFPLIGLIGYSLALLSGSDLLLVATGFVVLAAFLLMSYWHKLTATSPAGVTSELSGLATYVVGVLVWHDEYWVATAVSIACLFLLELKTRLEGLAQEIAPREVFTFTQFLLITAVLLPVVPNREFGPFLLNPYKAWLAVVAVSAVSYGSYVCLKLTKGRGGLLMTAILGGAYSSTVTTVALAKRAAQDARPNLISGAVLMASGIMYLRLLVLVGIFNRGLFGVLAPFFAGLSACGIVGGWLWSRRPDPEIRTPVGDAAPRNPLELSAALLFGCIFLAMLVITRLAVAHAGQRGIFALAAIMGITDVDPFILGLTQTAGATTTVPLAASGVLIAAASNNVVKGAYAYAWADRATGRKCLLLLAGLATLGTIPLIWTALS